MSDHHVPLLPDVASETHVLIGDRLRVARRFLGRSLGSVHLGVRDGANEAGCTCRARDGCFDHSTTSCTSAYDGSLNYAAWRFYAMPDMTVAEAAEPPDLSELTVF